METKPRARYHAERTFGADQQAERIDATGAASKVHALASAEHAIGRPQHVLDFSVAAGALPGAARRYPAADRRTQDARRKMSDAHALPLELGFEIDAEHTGFDFDLTRLTQHPKLSEAFGIDDDRASIR